jgi:hypothetical protein
MIKFFAALFMLIDHTGLIFGDIQALRIVGRLSMPLFAYATARGFYFSKKRGTVRKYARNLLLFSLVSQVPYGIMEYWICGKISLNIGITWLLAVVLMKILCTEGRLPYLCLFTTAVFALAFTVPVDYGIYGVLLPCLFYFTFFVIYKPQYAFCGMAALLLLYAVQHGSGVLIQSFSLAAFPFLLLFKKYDNKLRLPRRVFYWFYPAHIAVLLAIRYLTM